MQHSDTGAGYGKAIFTLLILIALAFVAFKAVPVYVHNYELQDYIRELAVRATVEHSQPEAVRGSVLAKAQELELFLTRENVNVTQSGGKIMIELDYSVPVDLKVYTWVIHFAPSAENRAL